MDSFGIVEEQVFFHLLVESGGVVKEKIRMIINEFILNRSVEAFTMSIHLGSLGIGVIVSDVVLV